MKRIISIFAVIAVLFCLASCGDAGASDTGAISFIIESDFTELAVGEGVFTFSVADGSRLGDYTAENILYTVNGYPIIGNTFLPMDPGVYTVTANVGGISSSNTLTLTVR